jgi:hypothetical protein
VGSTEPACINNPESGELITDKETMKKVSLEHCAKILTKNEIRACDKGEQKTKEKTHKKEMQNTDKDSYVLGLNMYNTELESLKKKDKNMFQLVNKSGKKYKCNLLVHEENNQ